MIWLKPRKLIHSKGALVEPLPNWLPCCAAVHQCAQMSVRIGPHGSSSNQELSTRAAQRVAKKLMTSPFPGFLDDQLEVDKSGKWVVGVPMITTNLLQSGAEDGTFGHPIRDPLASAAMIQWLPYDMDRSPKL